MQGRLLLDVVIRQGSRILQLLSREDQPLLLRWDSLLVLDLRLHVLNRVVRLHVQRNRFSGQRFDEDLHRSSSQPQHQVQGGLLLNVVIAQRSSILQLLSSEDQSLLLRWNPFFVLDLGLDILNGVIGFHIQRDGLSRQRLHEDLHGTSSQS